MGHNTQYDIGNNLLEQIYHWPDSSASRFGIGHNNTNTSIETNWGAGNERTSFDEKHREGGKDADSEDIETKDERKRK